MVTKRFTKDIAVSPLKKRSKNDSSRKKQKKTSADGVRSPVTHSVTAAERNAVVESDSDFEEQPKIPVPTRLPLKVKDNGAGISPQDIPKIFTKFTQTQPLATRNSGGSGLGLAICKRFVNLMDGHIWIESEGLGKGCTASFIVKLGFPDRPNESKLHFVPKVQANHVQTNFTGLKVLVMDENGVSRSVTKGLLVHLGCDVTTVSSSDECLRVVCQEHKVVFMDVFTDGYEFASHIRERFGKRHERPLVVALTGNTDKSTTENCIRFGLDGVILKPVSIDKMRNVLSELLEHRVLFEAM